MIRALFRDYGVKHGSSFMPKLDLNVSANEKSRRTDTFTMEHILSQFVRLISMSSQMLMTNIFKL